MFGLYFGNYLVEKNKISQSQFQLIMNKLEKTRAKMGITAISEKLLTTKQAEEINHIQRKTDQRFGDIAIEKGYLLAEEVTYLLNLQGNPYLQFVQVCTENDILTLHEIEDCLESYKNDYQLSASDLDAIKSGDIDRIIPVFVDINDPLSDDSIGLAIRNLVRFINNNIILRKSNSVHSYTFDTLAFQTMIGDHELFFGIAGRQKSLLPIANPFAREQFTEMNEDAFDSVCEFINCTNGLFASKLSHMDIHIDMTPPQYCTDKVITSQGNIYVVPIMIDGEQSDLIVALGNTIEIN